MMRWKKTFIRIWQKSKKMINFVGYLLRRFLAFIVNLLSLIFKINYFQSRLLKTQILISLVKNYNLKSFVESGTYLGDTSINLSKSVDKLYTIEVSKFLYNLAKFRLRKKRNIELIKGDSAEILGNLLKNIGNPCLFYLDGHYSGGISSSAIEYESPLKRELESIGSFYHLSGSIVVVDDARELGVTKGYPSIKEIEIMFKDKEISKIIMCDLLIIIFS